MTKTTASVLAALALATATSAAAAESASRSALKGCLLASPSGAYQYQLTEDETGTVYDLVGSSDQLGLLVGSDILVTGSRLEQNEDRIASSRDGRVASEGRANETSESDSRDQNSFRVTGAVKFNDLCVLSTTSTTYQRPDLEIEVQQ